VKEKGNKGPEAGTVTVETVYRRSEEKSILFFLYTSLNRKKTMEVTTEEL